MTIDNAQHYKGKIIELLIAEKLPVADLPERLDNFIVAINDGKVVGVGGLEVYATYGLLRSLAVQPEHRGAGVAAKMLARLESISKRKGLLELYLLTETAATYFEQKGFTKITRADVPAAVQRSSEFSDICPESAIVMKKTIT